MKGEILLVLVAVIIVSGCVPGLPFGPSTGVEEETRIVSEDLLKINRIDFLPGDILKPGSPFTVVMELENVGQVDVTYSVDRDAGDSEKDEVADGRLVFDGDSVLIDHCSSLYNITQFSVTPAPPANCSSASCKSLVRPGQTQMLRWRLKAPNETEILVGEHRCDFRFYLNYSARAVTNNYIYFASEAEITERLYTGSDMPLTGSNIATYGPLAINLRPAEEQPISTASSWIIYMTLQNKGSGMVNVKDMTLSMPHGVGMENLCRELFEDVAGLNKIELKTGGKAKAYRKVYEGSEVDIPCTLSSPQDVPILTPFLFTAESNYDYLVSETREVVTSSLR